MTLDVTTGDKTFRTHDRGAVHLPHAGFVHVRRPDRGAASTRSSSTAGRWPGTRSSPPAASPWPDLRPRTSCAWSPTRLHEHRRGPAPVRRPGRRRGLPLQPVRGGRRPPGLRVLRPARPQGALDPHRHRARALDRGRRLPHARARARPATARRAWRFEPTPRLSSYVQAVDRRAVPRRARLADEPRRPRDPARGLLPRARWPSTWTPTRSWRSRAQGFAYFEELFDLPVPVREVRPAVRAGVQRRRDGERRRGHDHASTTSSARRCPRRWSSAGRLTILHELAHMWFGDLVTMRWWNDLWLNESFAEYASTPLPGRGHPLAARPGRRSASRRSPGPTGRTSSPPRTRSSPTSATSRTSRSTSTASPTPRAPSVLKQLVALRRARRRSSRGCAAYFKQARLGQHRRCATCCAELEATSGRDLDDVGPAVAAAGRASTPCVPRSRSGPDGVVTRAGRRPGGSRPSTPCCARTASRSAATTSSTAGCVRTGRVELDVDGARTDGARASAAARARTCCSSTTTTWPTPRSGSTRQSLATAVAHLGAFADVAAAVARAGARPGT